MHVSCVLMYYWSAEERNENVLFNVLITKHRSIIVPKSNGNYLYLVYPNSHNGAPFAIFYYFLAL